MFGNFFKTLRGDAPWWYDIFTVAGGIFLFNFLKFLWDYFSSGKGEAIKQVAAASNTGGIPANVLNVLTPAQKAALGLPSPKAAPVLASIQPQASIASQAFVPQGIPPKF